MRVTSPVSEIAVRYVGDTCARFRKKKTVAAPITAIVKENAL
jgi:hypothetical protein